MSDTMETTGMVNVHLNGASIGRVSSEDFAAVRKAVFRSWRVAAAQLFNCIASGIKTTMVVIGLIPLVSFWIVVFVIANVPADLTLTGVGIGDLVPAVKQLLFIATLISVVLIILGAMMFPGTGLLGFRDVYQDEIHRRLRDHVMLGVLSKANPDSRGER